MSNLAVRAPAVRGRRIARQHMAERAGGPNSAASHGRCARGGWPNSAPARRVAPSTAIADRS